MGEVGFSGASRLGKIHSVTAFFFRSFNRCRVLGGRRMLRVPFSVFVSPTSKEYAATINRIKAQRRTGKISRADFTDFEDTAKAIVKQVDLGELTDVEAIRQLNQISRLRNRKRK